MINILCRIQRGVLNRWIIVDYEDEHLAWSGARWVSHDRGIPTGVAQICNYDSREEAFIEAENAGLVVI
jgi:hypothetical protein